MRVLLIKAISAYDAARLFIDDLALALERRGHQAQILDWVEVSDLGAALHQARVGGPIDLVYSITVLGEWRDGAGRSVSQVTGAPHVIQMVDYPPTHMARLDLFPPRTAVLTLDRGHAAAIGACYPPGRFAHVGFSPAAANGEIAPVGDDPDAWFASRPIPILFPGSYQAPTTEGWIQFPERIRLLLVRTVELMLQDEFIPAYAALETVMRMASLEPADPAFAGLLKLSRYPNEFVRSFRRVEFLETAARVGLPLQVFGRGYADHLERFPNITYRGEIGLAELLREMRRARIVININANFRDGAHDRPFTAAAAGAAVASDASTYLAEQFQDGTEIKLFSWLSLEAGLADMAALAHDPERAHAMARAGQRRVIDAHLWDHRVDAILEAAEAAREARPESVAVA